MIIDIAALISPISEDHPTGIDLRNDLNHNSLYYQLREIRHQAREAERRHYDSNEKNQSLPHWQALSAQCLNALVHHSKDLEISVWLTEALLRQHHFDGLSAGFALIHQIIEQYWENLFPMPDSDGIRTRLMPLIILNGEGKEGVLILPITAIPLFSNNAETSLTFWQYEQNGAENNPFPINASQVTYLRTLQDSLDHCIDRYTQLTLLLEQYCGIDAPPSSNIKSTLLKCRQQLYHFTDPCFTTTTDAPIVVAKHPKQNVERQHALNILLDIADFFQNNEPHSPLPYLLRRCVKWGAMPLPTLLSELISTENEKMHVFKLTGINDNKENL